MNSAVLLQFLCIFSIVYAEPNRPVLLLKSTKRMHINKGPYGYRKHIIVKPCSNSQPVYAPNPALMAEAVAEAAHAFAQTQFSKQGILQRPIDLTKIPRQCSMNLADPVSVALAYKQAQISNLNEDKLFYGFRKLPDEIHRPVYEPPRNIFPEESLYTINGPVVELKPVEAAKKTVDNLSEEAAEELLDLAASEEASKMPSIKQPCLSDLGFVPTKSSSTKFIDIPTVIHENVDE
ncbi:hypothetical protein ABEB36_007893 [Hypothenemus hampei]|uniref:Uncharacterized protein n=1 Tax=Hypothenemus hampei TaxID=57062 RepID=A0ABD1EVG6_HYPHA